MNNSISISATNGKTKDDLIHQAHEARQTRELDRRRDEAASSIQSFLKAAHVRIKLKREACFELDKILKQVAFPDDKGVLLLLRKLLFICDPIKDRSILDSLFRFIVSSEPSSEVQSKISAQNESVLKDTPKSLIEDAINETIESPNIKPDDAYSKTTYVNLVQLVVHDVTRDGKTLDTWMKLIEKILNLCVDYLRDANSSRLDSQHIDTYLKIINLFSSKKMLIVGAGGDNAKISEISSELLQKTPLKRKDFFSTITELICEKINRFRNDLKSSILGNYTNIVLSLLNLESMPQNELHPVKKELIDTLVKMLSVPGLIYNLEKYSPESLRNLNDHSIFTLTIKSLTTDQDIYQLNSTSSMFLLANVIHLAALNSESLAMETIQFASLIIKLLESCQKNMAPANTSIGNCKKKQSGMATTYNPILGWLSKETAHYFDTEVIRAQLSYLWSLKFLKILLSDLTKLNDKQNSASLNTVNKTYLSSNQSPKIRSDSKGLQENQPVCDIPAIPTVNAPMTSPKGLFRRIVERAATNMTKTINSSYARTTGSSNSGISKLVSPQANRISQVCCMLHMTLKTLTSLKQEILTGLCLHDYILPNLWMFISSLGSQNGLKAFLEYLTIYTKTSAPEFFILILFCECASHLISILDDSELYEKQRPFQLEDLVAISAFLNNFVFRIICNNLIPIDNNQEMDPILHATHKLLTDLYKRDCRRKFTPQDHWLIKDIKMSLLLKDLETGKPVAKTILKMLPHVIPHKERVLIFKRLVSRDKAHYCSTTAGPSTLITIHRSRIVEDGYQQLIRLPSHALKGLIRVKFINDFGLDEAGIDQDGVFKEFLEDTIKRVFDPALNLFCSTSEQLLYPSPTSRLHEDHLSLFKFVGKMLGKAIYEGIVVDVPFATFFLTRVLGQPQSPLYSPIDELPSLDPELYKSLTYIKHYEGDVSELDLTFSIDQDFMGKIETHELERGGKSIPVTRETRVRYIHAVANFRMKTQIEKQTEAFVSGFKSIINLEWLSMFSASEFQRLISGDNTPIDLQDLRRHTKYFGGFHNNHRVVCWLWDILEKDFTAEEHSLFLKFVTSCSKPPLLGFANLEPSFTIRCVEVSDDQDLGDTVGSVLRGFFAIRRSDPVDRLPTSSTCFNLLKLPNYQRRSTLRDKLRYAIQSNPGFELS